MNNNTVYVIDDDNEVLSALKWHLESVYLKVKTFANAIDFLEQYSPNHRGCLVTDIRMPGMSGLELLEKLKSWDSLLKIIMITGFGDITTAIRAMKTGAIDFIEKPVNEHDLLELIQTCLAPCNTNYYAPCIADKEKLLSEDELQALESVWDFVS